MDVKLFLQAMNEIDDSYLMKADRYGKRSAARRSRLSKISTWALPAAACLCIFAVFWVLRSAGLLTDAPAVSQGAAMDSQLPDAPELPELVFPSREEAGNTIGETIGCGLKESLSALSQKEIASIWGQEDIAFEGLSLTDDYTVAGSARTIEGEFQGVILTLSPLYGQGGDPVFMRIEIGRGHIPGLGTHFTGTVVNRCDVWGTEVSATAVYPQKEESKFSISFLTGPAGEEGTLGVVAECYCSSSDFPEETAKDLLTRLASQCLRPGNVFQISQLEQASDNAADPEESVTISKDGLLSFPDSYRGEFQAALYQAFSDSPTEMGGETALDKDCRAVLRLTYPEVFGEYLPLRLEEGQETKVLCKLYEIEYGFFEKDGKKYLEELGGYADLAGAVCRREADGKIAAVETWLPKDGSLYGPSVLEFCDGSEEKAQSVMERKASAEYPQELFESLLLSYAEQNGLSGYTLQGREEAEAKEKLRKEKEAQLEQFRQELEAKMEKAKLKEAAKQAAQDYVNSWMEEKDHPLAECFYENLRVTTVSEDKKRILVGLRMVFKVQDPADESYWMAGNTKEGAGEKEGYLTAARFLTVENSGGNWKITNQGTGGMYFEGESVDWPIG